MANKAPGTQIMPLEPRTFSHGGSVSVPTSGRVPPGRRVLKVLFDLTFTATQPAAPTTQNAASLYQLLALVKHGRRISIDGLGLGILNWMKNGREIALAADIPNTPNGVYDRRVQWEISYIDPTSRSPFDGALPSELFGIDPLDINFAAAANVFGGTAPTLTNATLRTYVIHDAGQSSAESGVAPSSRVISSQDFSALTATLEKKGAFLYVAAYRTAANDGGAITSTQAGSVSVFVDGETFVRALRLQDLASAFNASRANGSRRRSLSSVAPVPGESLNDTPNVGNGDGAVVAVEFAPLIFPIGQFYVSNQVAQAEKSLQFDFQSGTLTNYRIAYELIEFGSPEKAEAALRKLGIPRVGRWEVKAANKGSAIGASFAPYLPHRGYRDV